MKFRYDTKVFTITAHSFLCQYDKTLFKVYIRIRKEEINVLLLEDIMVIYIGKNLRDYKLLEPIKEFSRFTGYKMTCVCVCVLYACTHN